MTYPRSPKRSLYVVLALVLVLVSVTGISGCAKEEPEPAGKTLSLVIDCGLTGKMKPKRSLLG